MQCLLIVFLFAVCFTILNNRAEKEHGQQGTDYVEESTMEILLFGPCAHMFAQLPKNCVLVSWLLSPLLWNGFNICSVWQSKSLCGYMKNNPVWEHGEQTKSVFINPAFTAASPTSSIFFFCSSKLVPLTQSTIHSSSVLQKRRRVLSYLHGQLFS